MGFQQDIERAKARVYTLVKGKRERELLMAQAQKEAASQLTSVVGPLERIYQALAAGASPLDLCPDVRPRSCLGCRKMFTSSGPGHRFCPNCDSHRGAYTPPSAGPTPASPRGGLKSGD